MTDEFNWRELPPQARPDSGVLSDAGLRKFLIIHQIAIEMEARADAVQKEQLQELFGCLSKLSAFLAQVSRAAGIAQEIQNIPQGPAPTLHPDIQVDVESGMFHSGMGITYDQDHFVSIFESIVFQAGATMDRLAGFIGKHCADPNCKMISHLLRTLRTEQARDVRAEWLFRAYCEIQPTVEGILVGREVGGKFVNDCLRHDLIHNISLREFELAPFHIAWLADGRVLRFDCEFEYTNRTGSLRISVLRTIRSLTQSLAYIVLYAASVFLTRTAYGALIGHGLAREWNFGKMIGEPVWGNPTICMSDFLAEEGQPSIRVERIVKRWPQVTHSQFQLREDVLAFAT